jgi:hypothetical protein
LRRWLLRRRLLSGGLSGLQDGAEVRTTAGSLPGGPTDGSMTLWECPGRGHFTRSGMLHVPTHRLAFSNDPLFTALLKIIGKLHGRRAGAGILETHFDLSLSLVAVDGALGDEHVHGTEIQGLEGSKVVHDAAADGFLVARFGLAGTGEEKQCTEKS